MGLLDRPDSGGAWLSPRGSDGGRISDHLPLVSGAGLDVAAATDALTIGYNLFVLVFLWIAASRIGRPLAHAGFNGGVIALVLVLHQLRARNRLAALASLWHPVLLYTFLYYQTGLLNTALIPRFLDPYFQSLDVALFGRLPVFILHDWFPGRVAGELFHLSYFCYYLMIPAVAALLFRKDRLLFARFVFQLSALFYFCYAIYIFLPVEGPIGLRAALFQGTGLFERVVDFLYAKGEKPGAAFPSSHVAVAYLVARWGGVHVPRLNVPLLVVLALLSLATVYCSFHYGVDVIAGALLGIGALALMNRSCAVSWER